MREQEVKEIISIEIIKRMQDQSAASVLREILFDNDHKIDWDKAGNSIIENMIEFEDIWLEKIDLKGLFYLDWRNGYE